MTLHPSASAVFAVGLLIAASVFAATPACDTVAMTWKQRQISCPLPAEASPGRMRFVARFEGGHDDTEVSLAMTLDGQPLACGPGSQTELMGGDGDVVLECRFELAASQGAAARKLGATVRFHHAVFASTRLESR